MDTLVMDTIKGFGFLLIPGFLAIFLLALRHLIQAARPERAKANRYRVSGESRLPLTTAVLQPVKIRKERR